MTRDWHNAEDYTYTAHLNRAQWAWEFLRRHPGYRADWQWFWQTWRALEADYGAPPQRDFARWKRDPRAFRQESGTAGGCVVVARRWGVLPTIAFGILLGSILANAPTRANTAPPAMALFDPIPPGGLCIGHFRRAQ